jgi:phosphate transport system substrate-binding protein
MGYFGYDYYQANRNSLRALPVIGSRGAVSPSPESVQQSRYLPLSRPLFLYVNEQALRNEQVLRTFVLTTLQNGGRLSRQAGVIPLQDSTYRLVITKLYRNVLGSAFAGTLPLGLTVGQTLDRSFDALKKPEHR